MSFLTVTKTTWHRVQAVMLFLVYAAVISIGVVSWSSGATHWGITLDATDSHATSWRIATAASTPAIQNQITAGMYICRYNAAPIGHTTLATDVEQAITLTVATTPDCSSTIVVSLASDSVPPATAVIDFIIAVSCGIVATLIVQHARQRRLVLHVTSLLSVLVIAFGWLPVSHTQTELSIAEIAAASYLLPSLLTTLLWRLFFSTPRRVLVRTIFFIAMNGLAALLTIAYILSTVFANDQIFLRDRQAGLPFLLIAYLSALVVVVIAAVSRQSGVRRDYVRVIGGGAIVAIIPLVVFGILPPVAKIQLPIDASVAAISFIALPLSLAFVVLKRELLGVDSFVRFTVERALAIFGIIFVIAVILSTVVALAHLPTATAAILFVPMLVVAIIAPLTLRSAQWVTERWLFPDVRRYRQVLARATVPTGIASSAEIGEEIGDDIKSAFPVPRVALFVRSQTGDYFTEATKPGSAHTTMSIAADHPLVRALMAGKTTDQDDIVMSAAEREQLAPWVLFAPMVLRQRLIGFIATSPRDDDETLSPTDRQVIQFLTASRAIPLDYASVVDDLRIALEDQKELDRLKDEFIMTAHHELRTPMTVMLGVLGLFEEASPAYLMEHGAEMQELIKNANAAGSEMMELITTLLSADQEALRTPVTNPTWVDISDHVAQLIAKLQITDLASKHTITTSLALGATAWTDPQQIDRVLQNIITNASKYSPMGAPIAVIVRRSLRHSGRIEIGVRDYGAGIAPQYHTKIFEKFVRLDSDLNSAVRGSGLGLYVVRKIVEAMNGTIWVESRGIPGEGSTFFVSLPMIPPDTTGLTPTRKMSSVQREELFRS